MTVASPTQETSSRDVALDPPTSSEQAAQASRAKPSRAKRLLVILSLSAVLISGIAYWSTSGRETTDDAQVEGRVIAMSPRVSGQVRRVLVVDNQRVEAGDALVELDPADYAARLEAAIADLEIAQAGAESAKAALALTERITGATMTQAQGGVRQASSSLDSTRATIQEADAALASAESRLALAQLNLTRAENLFADHSTTQSDVDTRRAEFDVARAAVAQQRAHRQSAYASFGMSEGSVVLARGRLAAADTAAQQLAASVAALRLAEARVKQAEAARKLAELNLSYTTIRAPKRGTVARRTVEEGQIVSPDRPLLAIVPTNDIWVVANFKEDQLAEMKPGQPARVRFDTYGRRDFEAHVESLAAGSGSRFALIPPDNASGNFVKVVQRVPVLIRLESLPDLELRPGMSADVLVRTDGAAL